MAEYCLPIVPHSESDGARELAALMWFFLEVQSAEM